jgi:hypothetical protein
MLGAASTAARTASSSRYRAGATSRHGHGGAGEHQIHLAACNHTAGGLQLVDGVGGQEDHIKGLFTGLHTLRGIHTTHGFDLHRLAALGLPGCNQIREDLAGCHGRNAFECCAHAGRLLKWMPWLPCNPECRVPAIEAFRATPVTLRADCTGRTGRSTGRASGQPSSQNE